jgi:hypothetical protein
MSVHIPVYIFIQQILSEKLKESRLAGEENPAFYGAPKLITVST